MKIVVLMLGRFGDLVLSTALLKKLASYTDTGKVDVICGAKNYQLLVNENYVDKVLVLDKQPFKLLLLVLKLMMTKYDLFIDPKDHKSTESKLICAMVRATTKAGYKKNHDLFNQMIPTLDSYAGHTQRKSHHSSKMMNSIKALDPDYIVDKDGYKPSLSVGENEKAKREKFLRARNIRQYALLNISASTVDRYPTLEFWIQLIPAIKLNMPLIITYAPGEAELANSVLAELSPKQEIYDFGLAQFTDIIALIAGAELLISPDTAVVHVASAFDTPIFAFFSWNESKTRSFYPLTDDKIILWAKEGDSGVRSITADEAEAEWYQKVYNLRFSKK